MNEESNNLTLNEQTTQLPHAEAESGQEPQGVQIAENQTEDNLEKVISALGVSDTVAASARAILEPIANGTSPSRAFVELIVKALRHDEDVKNAEAAGYLRGRNETIEVASRLDSEASAEPVHFPVYRKRSFWD